MRPVPRDLGAAALEFLRERHLASLTSLRADGSPHVVAVGFTWEPENGVARIITSAGTQKALNTERGSRLVLCQIDGARWLSLEGTGRVLTAPDAVADAERRYAERYRPPRPNPRRVVIEIRVRRVLGARSLLT